jgi:hypothetical protein
MNRICQADRLLAFLDDHLAGFEGRGEGLLVAVGDGTGEGVFFGGAFEPAARHFTAWQLAFLEKSIHRTGGDAKGDSYSGFL